MNRYDLPSSLRDAAPPESDGPSPLRLLLVFVLGLISALFASPLSVQPRWLQPAIALSIVLLATILSAAYARTARGGVAILRKFIEVVGILLVLGGLGGAFIALTLSPRPVVGTPAYQQAFLQIVVAPAAIIPILMGAACGLVAQRRPSFWRALGGATLGWLGATMANIVVAIVAPTLDPAAANPEGVVTSVVIVAAVSAGGFVLAALGSAPGWALRVLGTAGAAKTPA